MTLFGQSCLAARRLLEVGGKFVTVSWDKYGLVNTGWDTHVHMRSRQFVLANRWLLCNLIWRCGTTKLSRRCFCTGLPV